MSVPLPVGAAPGADDHYSKSVDPQVWWNAHFNDAAEKIIAFLGGDGLSLEGKRVCDIGCGDGIIDLALTLKARPARLVGFDLQTVDLENLAARARTHADVADLPDELFFATSGETTFPADDDSFDVAVSWSAFEHIADATAVLREIRRVLTDQGVLFIQVWPFYSSAHGSHLVDWFPDGFAQYRFSDEEITRQVRSRGNQSMAAEMLPIYQTLNRITADELHEALRTAGFKTVKVSLSAETVHLGDEVSHLPWSHSVISGIELLAIPDLRPELPLDPPPSARSAAADSAIPPGAAGSAGPEVRQSAAPGAVGKLRRGLRHLDERLARFQ